MNNLEPLPSEWQDIGWIDTTDPWYEHDETTLHTWGRVDPLPPPKVTGTPYPLIPEGSLQGYLGPGSKRVVINDYLSAGVMFMTEGEIILSSKGWENLVRLLEVRNSVREIVERELADVLAWLREAGHDV